MGKRRNRKRTRPSSTNNDNVADATDAAPAPPTVTATAPPITHEGQMPQKKFYRSRAHCNPLSFNEAFDYPPRPDLFDWTEEHYPNHPLLSHGDGGGTDAGEFSVSTSQIHPTVLDVGCGFGGLTLALSALLPDETILGLEIRSKVTEYVRLRILASRKEAMAASESDGDGNVTEKHDKEANTSQHRKPTYQNASVLRTNAMKYLPNHIPPRSLSKLFFCFPDPHFKKKNHPRRIVSTRLLSEYAHWLRPGEGKLYCITDVRDLHEWHVERCEEHPLFEEVGEEEMEGDECVKAMRTETEEGKKVRREGREMWWKVYRRVGVERERELQVGAEGFFGRGEFGVVVEEEQEEEIEEKKEKE